MTDTMQDTALDNAEAFLTSTDGEEVTPERMKEVEELGGRIIGALKNVYDPEIPVDIYELGLIYKIDIEDDNGVQVEMTLTSPHCPVAESLPIEVQERVAGVEGVTSCNVDITWDPPWNPQMMSEEAQLELGMVY